MKLLLGRGVDVDVRDLDGRTPLSYAAENGHEMVVKLLLDTGKVFMEWGDNNGRTPYSFARKNGHDSVVKLLEWSSNIAYLNWKYSLYVPNGNRDTGLGRWINPWYWLDKWRKEYEIELMRTVDRRGLVELQGGAIAQLP